MVDTFLVPPRTVVDAKGDSAAVEVSGAANRVFLLNLEITNIVEQESLNVSIYGSGAGVDPVGPHRYSPHGLACFYNQNSTMGPSSSVIVRPARNIAGQVTLPGDKSISHRYAMLAAIADGTTRLENFSTGADCAS